MIKKVQNLTRVGVMRYGQVSIILQKKTSYIASNRKHFIKVLQYNIYKMGYINYAIILHGAKRVVISPCSLLGYQHLTVKIISNSITRTRIRIAYPFSWASPSPTLPRYKISTYEPSNIMH